MLMCIVDFINRVRVWMTLLQRKPQMAMKLFVGSLPWATTSQDLNDLFSQFGAVTSATVLTDRDTGRSRGFGFVEFDNREDAEKAISALDGSDYQGRSLKVSEAKPQEDRPRRSFGGR